MEFFKFILSVIKFFCELNYARTWGDTVREGPLTIHREHYVNGDGEDRSWWGPQKIISWLPSKTGVWFDDYNDKVVSYLIAEVLTDGNHAADAKAILAVNQDYVESVSCYGMDCIYPSAEWLSGPDGESGVHQDLYDWVGEELTLVPTIHSYQALLVQMGPDAYDRLRDTILATLKKREYSS